MADNDKTDKPTDNVRPIVVIMTVLSILGDFPLGVSTTVTVVADTDRLIILSHIRGIMGSKASFLQLFGLVTDHLLITSP